MPTHFLCLPVAAFQRLRTSIGNMNPIDVVINRATLLEDCLKVYEDSTIVENSIRVEFLGEVGQDQGGLTKDLLTSVWIEIFQKYFRGENVAIPFLPLHLFSSAKDDYVKIGRILSHTASILNIIPTRISKVMLICLIYGYETIDEEMLLCDFLQFLNLFERNIVQLALKSYSALNQRQIKLLTDMFCAFGLQDIPRQQRIRDQILTIARNELIDRPAPLVALIKRGIPLHQMDGFWTQLAAEDISSILRSEMPSGSKLVEVISIGDQVLTQQQETTLYFIKSYIMNCDADELSKFLWFVTGSTTLPPRIEIVFTTMFGAARRPIAHTCSNTLELSDTYWSYQDLRDEMRAVLATPMAFEMNML